MMDSEKGKQLDNDTEDVFSHAFNAWVAEKRPAAVTQAAAAEFMDYARSLFAANNVIGQNYMAAGVSLRFQDGMVLPFCLPPAGAVEEQPGFTGMAVTPSILKRGGPGTINTGGGYEIT